MPVDNPPSEREEGTLSKEFSCPSCGADLKLKGDETHVICPYCESTVFVPDEYRTKPSKTHPPVHSSGTDTDYQAARRAAMQQAAKSAKFGRLLGCIMPILIIGFILLMNFLFNPAFHRMFGGALNKVASGVGLAERQELLSFGGEGTGAGLFEDARYVTADAQGNIYVAEYGGGRVQVFDDQGQFQTQWFAGDGDDIYIGGMDATADGRLAVTYDSELWILDGETGEVLRQLRHPDGWGFEDVCVADDGSVLAGWYKSRDDLVRFSPDGKLDLHVREVVSGITGDSELDTRVAVDGRGDIYVLGSFNCAVVKYSRNGEFRSRFGSSGDAEGQFSSPGALETDGQGNLHVTDMFGVKVYAPDGRYLDTWAEGGYVRDLDYRDGRMYMVDTQQRVRVLRVPAFE